MAKRWTQEEVSLLESALTEGMTYKEISTKIDRSWDTCRKKAKQVGFYNAHSKTKTHNQYVSELPKDISVLDMYVNAHTYILHKHVCGHKWKAKPNNILSGRSCPVCNIGRSGTFAEELPAQLYVVDFGDNLYKIGVSSNYKTRLSHFGLPCEVVYIREFTTGKEALKTEQQYLKNVRKYLYNTGKLRGGNTETFLYK